MRTMPLEMFLTSWVLLKPAPTTNIESITMPLTLPSELDTTAWSMQPVT